MIVPKLTSDNFEDFDLAFQGAARRQVGLSRIPIDYLLHNNDTRKYYAVWKSKEEKLKNCVIFVGKFYRNDTKIIYTLIVQ